MLEINGFVLYFFCIVLSVLLLSLEQTISGKLAGVCFVHIILRHHQLFVLYRPSVICYQLLTCVCLVLAVINPLLVVHLVQAISETLSVGAALLLPPLRERMALLHALLPQGLRQSVLRSGQWFRSYSWISVFRYTAELSLFS